MEVERVKAEREKQTHLSCREEVEDVVGNHGINLTALKFFP